MSTRLNLVARLVRLVGQCSLALGLLALAAGPLSAQAQNAGRAASAMHPTVLRGAAAQQRAFDLGLPLRIETAEQVLELQAFVDDIPKYYGTHNAVAADSISTDECQPGGSSGWGLTGAGVTLGLWDAGGVRLTHQEFGGRALQMDSPSGTHYHSTHCAGTMIASGVVAAAKGMSPAANLDCWDWDNDESEMRTAAGNGLLVSSHSYGFATGWTWNSSYGVWFWYGDVTISPTEDNWFGLYTSYTQEVDDIAYDRPYYLICKSAGNDRNDDGPGAGGGHYYYNPGSGWEWSTTTRDPDGPWDCLATKAVAKNLLVVAAVEDVVGGYAGPGSVAMSSFSSYGPTDDGRIKPDIAGNGVGLYSTFDGSNSDYYSLSGTSMSTPNISGSLGILIQHWHDTHAGQGEMRSATLKGLVLHTADECGTANGPDYRFGWGLMNTLHATQAISADVTEPYTISEQTLSNGQTFELNATTDGGSELRVSICWTDPAGTPPGNLLNPPDLMLVNDLDLRVERTSPPATYYPWVLDPANPDAAATTGDNFRDNVEQVVVYSPGSNSYTIRVTHKGTLSSGSQAFSLLITGAATIGAIQDSDGDGVPDADDNCPNDYNPTQLDSDGDDVGDACDGCPYDINKTEPGLCGCGVADTDSDNDGTPDCYDNCPNDPYKTEPGQCGCGTPDTDSDNDGTADCNDGCPNDPYKTEPGLCGCGVADTDSDNDGTPDCNDICPNDPYKTEPGLCGCGVADTDSDNDGTPDCNDDCPNDPYKTEPGQCGCGNPDTDSDNDGTADCNDGCPNDPNKVAPGICGCGTPDTDSDNDGTPDCNDGCPNDPDKTDPGLCGCGVADTDSDNDGTPDCNDECPDDPDKVEPGQCGCGTPDTDSDNDGTPDCNDGCPNDPDKIAPGVCGCGAPDTDSDNDGTPDCNDGCPNDPDKIEPGICGCGIPDTDSDNDGTPDCNDQCPDDPDKVEPGQCGCGTPDTDSDNDGTADCNDGCPNDPDKVAPGICGCGVPDTDSDNDGTPDCNDQCPDDPYKTEPGVCGCGVSDADSDADGVPDCNDLCPDTPAGALVDEDGCPVSDCNGNGVPDETDIAQGTSQDCNQNAVPDECDIASGTSQDGNENGVPDECEAPPVCPGDCNCDGLIDFNDINAFVAAVTSAVYCDGTGANADVSQDTPIHVGFEDINPFVALLTTNPLPIACP